MTDPARQDQQTSNKKSLLDSRLFQVCLGIGLAVVFLSVIVIFRVFFSQG